jgi:predicted enzyme related to lactoylglutathione lyase
MSKFESYIQGTPSWVELITPDQRSAGDFYSQLFGWDVETVPVDDQGNVYALGKIEGDSVAGIGGQGPELAGHPAFWGVYLAVDDVDAATAKVAAAGGEVEAGPFDVMEQGRMSAIRDPSGARVNLWQAKDSIGTERANEPGTPVWNELVSSELDKALPFYADVLGMSAEPMSMEGAPADAPPYSVLSNAAGAQAGGACPPPMPGLPPHWNVYFQVEDADDAVARVAELGGTVIAAPFDVPGIGRLAVLSDPQWAMFNLMSPVDMSEGPAAQ